jgi:hypothetical protein
VSLFGGGAGLAYFVVPSNGYVAGTLELSQVTAEGATGDNGSSNSKSVELTDMGIGGALAVGKEWWVSTDWALGAAGLFRLSSLKMKDVDDRMTASSWPPPSRLPTIRRPVGRRTRLSAVEMPSD